MNRCEAINRSRWLGVAGLAAVATLVGCNRGPELAAVDGVVTYNGEPLSFGSVMFQGPNGPAATGTIGEGGLFQLEVRGLGAGAMVGTNHVRVSCYETQNPDYQAPANGEMSLGRSLIPAKYTNPRTSPLSVDVSPGVNRVKLDLNDE